MHIGLSELMLTGFVALMVIKPQQWPELLHRLGRGLGHCKRLYDQLQHQWRQTLTPDTTYKSDDS